jgi:hypothetical protein
MLYDTIRNPHARHTPKQISAIPTTKDVLESTQKRLNRETLERFQRTSVRLPTVTYVAAAQVGKYLFLAIMVPPYIAFYGIPKWLLSQVIPQIFIAVKNEFQRVGRFFNEISKQVIDVMKGILEQMIGDAFKALNNSSQKFIKFSYHRYEFYRKKAREKMKQMRLKGWGWVVSRNNAWRRHVANLQEAIKVISKRFQEKTAIFFRKMDQAIHSVYDAFDQRIIQPCIHWLEPKFDYFFATVRKMWNVASRLAKGCKERVVAILKTTVLPIAAFVKLPMQTIYEVGALTIQFLFNRMRPRMSRLKSFAEQKYHRLWRSLTHRSKKIRKKVTEIITVAFDVIKGWAVFLAKTSLSCFIWMGRLLNSRFQRWLSPYRSFFHIFKKVLSRLGTLLSQKIRKLFLRRRSIAQMIVNGIATTMNFARFAFRWLKIQLQTFPRKVHRYAISMWHLLIRGIRYLIYLLRLFVAWTWVLMRHGMSLVRELTAEISHWFQFKKV